MKRRSAASRNREASYRTNPRWGLLEFYYVFYVKGVDVNQRPDSSVVEFLLWELVRVFKL